jgi:hypothetical protein
MSYQDATSFSNNLCEHVNGRPMMPFEAFGAEWYCWYLYLSKRDGDCIGDPCFFYSPRNCVGYRRNMDLQYNLNSYYCWVLQILCSWKNRFVLSFTVILYKTSYRIVWCSLYNSDHVSNTMLIFVYMALDSGSNCHPLGATQSPIQSTFFRHSLSTCEISLTTNFPNFYRNIFVLINV